MIESAAKGGWSALDAKLRPFVARRVRSPSDERFGLRVYQVARSAIADQRVQRGRQQLRTALEECCHIALDARGRVVSCEPRPDGRLPDCRCK